MFRAIGLDVSCNFVRIVLVIIQKRHISNSFRLVLMTLFTTMTLFPSNAFQDTAYPDVRNRSHLLSFYREADRSKFNVATYNAKKDLVAKLEHELKLLKAPPVVLDFTKPLDEAKD